MRLVGHIILALIICPIMVGYGISLVIRHHMPFPNLKAFLYASIFWLALVLLWKVLVSLI